KADFAAKLKGEKKEQWQKLKDELAAFDHLRPRPLPFIPSVTDVGPVAPEVTIPGRRDAESIEPGPLSVLDPLSRRDHAASIILPVDGPAKQITTGRRTTLAHWIASADNPLPS